MFLFQLMELLLGVLHREWGLSLGWWSLPSFSPGLID
jgi:hypothetical protein